MAIKQKTVITQKISGAGTSHSRSEVTLRDVSNIIDEPIERGGTNEGLSPTETAFSSLIGCTNVIGHKCAKKLGLDFGNLSFEMEIDFDRRGVLLIEEIEVPFVAIRMEVTADGDISQEDLDRVAVDTAKFCPISKMYENAGTKVTVNWSVA